jgi:hypothetical protein
VSYGKNGKQYLPRVLGELYSLSRVPVGQQANNQGKQALLFEKRSKNFGFLACRLYRRHAPKKPLL